MGRRRKRKSRETEPPTEPAVRRVHERSEEQPPPEEPTGEMSVAIEATEPLEEAEVDETIHEIRKAAEHAEKEPTGKPIRRQLCGSDVVQVFRTEQRSSARYLLKELFD